MLVEDDVVLFGVGLCHPQVSGVLAERNLTLYQVTIHTALCLRSSRATGSVVQPGLKQNTATGLVGEYLPSGLAVVERLGVVGVSGGEHDESVGVSRISRTTVVV